MKKWLCILLALMLPLSSLAGARMPQQRGNINDAADVLSAQTISDLSRFGQLVSKEADIDLHVVTVHFLDGMDVQAYADALFEEWQLEAEDLLLLGAAGEDSYAAAMGSDVEEALGRANADNLLYTSSQFGQLFRTQQYDAAFAAYAQGLNSLLEKQTGQSVRMDGLFGQQPSTVSEQLGAYGGELWQEVMESINQSGEEVQDHLVAEKDRENGLTAGGWIVLIVLILIVLRQNRRDRLRRGAGRGRLGCGCSPLGWILGLLGLHCWLDRD